MRRLAAGLLVLAGLAPAQVTRTETQSVLVDVLVTDKKGNAIQGLTERDFQVFEDGKEQAVDGLFKDSSGAGQSSVIFLFDNAAMTSREQSAARQIAIKLLDQFATSGANLAVLDFVGGLRVSQGFTKDVTRAKTAVTKGSGSALSADGGGATAYGTRDLLKALDGLAKNLQGAQGRKTLVFFSPGYTISGDTSQTLSEVIGAANRSNVSFYPVNTRIVATSGNAVADVSAGPGPSPSPRGRGPSTTTLTGAPTGMAAANAGLAIPDVEAGPALLGPLLKLAEATGGFVVRQADDPALLAKVSKEQNEFYILSYTPPDSPDGSCHKLRVKVKRDGVNIRARDGYCKRTPGALLSGNPKEKTLEAKALAAQSGNIAASMQAPFFYKGSNVARVAAVLEIATGNIAFKKEKNKFAAQLDVMGIANQPDGSTGAKFSDIVKLEFDTQAQVDQFKAAPYRYENQFDIAPGRYTLAVALASGTDSFAKIEAPLVIAPLGAGEFGLSSLALVREFRAANNQTSGLDEFLIDDRKKFLTDGGEAVPAGSSKLKKSGIAGIFVEIYQPLLATPETAANLGMGLQLRVRERSSGVVKADSGPIRLEASGKQGQTVVPLALNVPVQDLAPGAYSVELEVVDSTGNSAKRSTPFEIE